MLRWRELHPYNAVHVAHVDRPLDAARLQALIESRLEALGLTGLALDAARARYEYLGGPAHAPLTLLEGGGDPRAAMDGEIERQLNAPFAIDGRIDPFRFFVVTAGSGFHLGLAYDHFVAGGDSVVLLLKDLIDHYAGGPQGNALSSTLERYPATFRRLFLQHPWRFAQALGYLIQSLAGGRRAHRPHDPRAGDMRDGFMSMRIGATEASALRAAVKAWDVTPNDFLMATLLLGMVPFTEDRRTAPRRKRLAVASIVNLRNEFNASATTTFGQFLSSFQVSHAMPAGIALEQLARDIHAQTSAIKRQKRYYPILIGIRVVNATVGYVPPEDRPRFHAKTFPLWAGTTPLNVDALWNEAGATQVAPAYLRGVSTGPLMPMVLAATTAGGALELGFSYRTAAFTREKVDKIADGIRDSIRSVAA
jgi:hypothetical protein